MANVAYPLLESQLVYLDHDAIGFVGQALPSLHPGVVKFLNLLNGGELLVVGVHLKAQALKVLHGLPVGGGSSFTFGITQHIDIDIQRAFSGNTGVKLAHRASGGIPGVGKQGLPFLSPLPV